MNKKYLKRFYFFAMMLAASVMTLTFSACGGDDDDDDNKGNGSSSGLTGWYIRQDIKGSWLDISSDDYDYTFNMQGEIIGIGKAWPYTGSEANMSTLGQVFGQDVYYIPDDETFIKYEGIYYKENASSAAGKTLLYKFNYGTLGTLGLYATHSYYYTYWREGNKLYTTEDGWTVYTVTPNGIIRDGSSFVFSKYDPNQIY